MKRLLLFLILPILTTVNAQYTKMNSSLESPYFLRVGGGALRGKPCLYSFNLYTKEGNIPVEVFECSDNRYKNGKLIEKTITDNTGFKKTKIIQLSSGIHYLQFIAYANNKYIYNEKVRVQKKCK